MDRELLLAALKQIRKQDFLTDSGEYIDGVVAVAVPVRDHNKHLYGTVSFHAPATRMSLDEARQYVSRLHQAAADLSRSLQ